MPVIAVTGGIASGKSTCTHLLAEMLPAEAFDVDASARRLLEDGSPALAEVRAEFGPAVFDAAGQIDRAALRGVVFADEERRRALEAIIHPRVRAAWTGWSRERLQIEPDALLLVEIPLLYETGGAALVDKAIVVGCSPKTQQRRLTGQRRLPAETAARMAASQWDLAEKIRLCDHLIWNDGSEESLRAQTALCARYLLNFYRRLQAAPPHE